MLNRSTSGFTLIEMLISLAAGSAIVVVATAGFRTATQSLAVVNRIAIQNAMLVAGFEAATNEIDFWTAVDNPDDKNNQVLRGSIPASAKQPSIKMANGFLPFTAFKNTTFSSSPAAGSGLSELTTGWSPNPIAWAACDPRTWSRQAAFETSNGDRALTWGNWTLFSHVRQISNPNDILARHWYEGQVKGLIDALGFYGMCDYLPSNAFYLFRCVQPVDVFEAKYRCTGWPVQMLSDFNGSNSEWARWLGDRNDGFPLLGRAAVSNTDMPFFPTVVKISPRSGGNNFNNFDFYKIYFLNCRKKTMIGSVMDTNTDFSEYADLINNYLRSMTNYPAMMATIPGGWPDVGVKVLRWIDHGRNINQCIVDYSDAKSGVQFSVPFSCTGTTLRGARQQRRPDQGWVNDFTSEPTLDYETAP